MQVMDQVTVFEPTIEVVARLMQLSWEHHLGFVDMGKKGELLVPNEMDGMYWFPEEIDKIVNQTKYHKEVYRRLDLIHTAVPNLEYKVVIGHEIKEGPEWDEVKRQATEKLKENKEAIVKAAKIIVPLTLVVAGGAVVVGVVASAAAAAAAATTAAATVAAPSVGTAGALAMVTLVGLDPAYAIIVDGHWVMLCSWLD